MGSTGIGSGPCGISGSIRENTTAWSLACGGTSRFSAFGSVGTDLQPQGYDIDMAQYLADKMKLKLQLVSVTSANRVPYLQTDKVDLVISSLGKIRSGKSHRL